VRQIKAAAWRRHNLEPSKTVESVVKPCPIWR
jgi:hypothetical protein